MAVRRILRAIGRLVPAMLAGGFFFLAVARILDPDQSGRAVPMLFGALYATAVTGLIRLFRVSPWAYAVVGMVCGPLPLFLLGPGGGNEEERWGMWLLSALFGIVLGLIETARVQQRARRSAPGAPASEDG